MKISPLFTAENGSLVRIADGIKIDTFAVTVVPIENIVSGGADASEELTAVLLPWRTVELEPGIYNEEILAALRDYLKLLEAAGKYAFIIPVADRDLSDSDEADSFIQAAVHSARRIKDCVCVAGFAIPLEFLRKDGSSGITADSYTQQFIDELSVKHSQYIYFTDVSVVGQCGFDTGILRSQFVMYSLR